MKRPNIVYIHSHDTGRYVGPYGHALDTPNIQKLAQQGTLFRQAFCANPTCSPSRASLLTGSYPHNNGMLGLAHRGASLYDYRRHLSNYLKEHGYATALSGIQHEAAETTYEQELGYMRRLDKEPGFEGLERDEAAAEAAARYIRETPDEPFFLSCGFFATHRTGFTEEGVQWHNDDASPAGDPRYCEVPAPLPDTPEVRRDFADYATSVHRLDRYMGQVFDALEAAGIADNTILICTTDHGIAFPNMKCNLTDHGMGVMLIIRGPGGFSGGKVHEEMVSHLDLFPTICEAAELPPPPWLQGRSLIPLVRGEKDELHEAVFAEVNCHAAAEPQRAVRTPRFKYIRRFDPQPHPVLPNCDDSVSKRLLLAHGWGEVEQREEMLFDLMLDPNESANVADDPEYAEPLSRMRDRLQSWMKDTDDPLLSGKFSPPGGFRLNPVDGPSPGADDTYVVE